MVLSKRKPAARKDKIILLNASKRYLKGKPKNYLPEDQICAIAALYQKGDGVEGELAIITIDEAEKADYNLSPSRWVGQSDSAEVGSVPNLIHALERLNKQDIQLTSDLLRLMRPLSDMKVTQ